MEFVDYMEITYLGHSSFRIKGKTATVVTDPYDGSMLSLKFPKVDADIVTVSHHHKDHDNVGGVAGVKRVVDGPGEYEINGVSIIGISAFHDDKEGGERGKNTLYVIEMDSLRLLHLGDLGHKLTDNQIKAIGNIDILFLPVGGTFTIDAAAANEVTKQVGPSIVIPMHYKIGETNNEVLSKLTSVDDFIKESGLRVEKLPKLSIKEGDIVSDETYAVILTQK